MCCRSVVSRCSALPRGPVTKGITGFRQKDTQSPHCAWPGSQNPLMPPPPSHHCCIIPAPTTVACDGKRFLLLLSSRATHRDSFSTRSLRARRYLIGSNYLFQSPLSVPQGGRGTGQTQIRVLHWADVSLLERRMEEEEAMPTATPTTASSSSPTATTTTTGTTTVWLFFLSAADDQICVSVCGFLLCL